ncbi:DUF5641 domain-containing protein, partial [Trichonephila clavipes]
VEGILNSRPLTPLSSDADNFDVLTPGHFLIGRPVTSILEPNLIDVNENRLRRWKKLPRELLRIVGIRRSELWRQPRPVTGCYAYKEEEDMSNGCNQKGFLTYKYLAFRSNPRSISWTRWKSLAYEHGKAGRDVGACVRTSGAQMQIFFLAVLCRQMGIFCGTS